MFCTIKVEHRKEIEGKAYYVEFNRRGSSESEVGQPIKKQTEQNCSAYNHHDLFDHFIISFSADLQKHHRKKLSL
jgi:hypothetical protein